MNAIKGIRTKMGLTQEQMGQSLGVSRTMIEHCETGRKKLGTPALLRLSALEKMLHDLETQQKNTPPEDLVLIFSAHYEKYKDHIYPEVRTHASKTKKMQQQYLFMRDKYNISQIQLEVVQEMIAKNDTSSIEEQLYLEMTRINLYEKIIKTDKLEQVRLKAKIFGRMRELEVLSAEFQGKALSFEP